MGAPGEALVLGARRQPEIRARVQQRRGAPEPPNRLRGARDDAPPRLDRDEVLRKVQAHRAQRVDLRERQGELPDPQMFRAATRPVGVRVLVGSSLARIRIRDVRIDGRDLHPAPRVLLDRAHHLDDVLVRSRFPVAAAHHRPLRRDVGGDARGDASVLARASRVLHRRRRVGDAHPRQAPLLQERRRHPRVVEHHRPDLRARDRERVPHVDVLRDVSLAGDDRVRELELQISRLRLEPRALAIVLKLRETLAHHRLREVPLQPRQVHEHPVAQLERGVQGVAAPHQHLPRHLRVHPLVDHRDHLPLRVQAAPPRAPRHLRVLPARDPAVPRPVELTRGGEHHRLRRHVQPRAHRLRREQNLHQILLEQELDDLLHPREEARVVDADAPSKRR